METVALTEAGVSFDLDLRGYHFKWNQAKQLAETHHLDMPYWMRVRTLFLELGGNRIDMRPC